MLSQLTLLALALVSSVSDSGDKRGCKGLAFSAVACFSSVTLVKGHERCCAAMMLLATLKFSAKIAWEKNNFAIL